MKNTYYAKIRKLTKNLPTGAGENKLGCHR